MAGSTLLLPIAAPAGSKTDANLVASASMQTTPDIVKVYTRSKARETLADVAQRSKVAVHLLAQWNSIAIKRAHKPLATGKALALWVQRDRASDFLAALPVGRKAPARARG